MFECLVYKNKHINLNNYYFGLLLLNIFLKYLNSLKIKLT